MNDPLPLPMFFKAFMDGQFGYACALGMVPGTLTARMFTTNKVKAAPVKLDTEHLKNGRDGNRCFVHM